jgi:hypothetical protein
MSKNPIRKDKTCLNCNHVVDLRYCPNCGQENTDTRKTFHHLFIHFFEDLTHYENAFWKTIRNLFFKPSSLTKEYLSGKRLSYLAPVRLYIFISFVTFFLLAVIPDNGNTTTNIKTGKEIRAEREARKKKLDSIKAANPVLNNVKDVNVDYNMGYDSVAQMDSIRKTDPNKINAFVYWLNTKMIPLNDKYSQKELKDKFFENAERNFPKMLFIYMPLFAFMLWLIHSKKRWYYFDHGIFTLHYFSFLLLITLILFLMNRVLDLFDSTIISVLSFLINTICYIWMIYYFFPAHHRFYGESRTISFFKSCFLYFINFILFTLIIILFFIYTFINIH